MIKKIHLRLESIIIALRCLFFSFSKIIFKKTTSPDRSFAIVNLTSNIGDMVLTTVLINAIKENNKDSKVIVVGSVRNEILFVGNKNVDHYVPFRSFSEASEILHSLKPTFGICMNQSIVEFGLLYLSNVKKISSFYFPSKAGITFILIKHLLKLVKYESGKYVPQELLRLLVPFNINTDASYISVYPNKVVTDKIKGEIKNSPIGNKNKFVVVAPTAGQAFKEWPTDRLSKLIKHLWEMHGIATALTGSPNDSAVGEEILMGVGSTPIFNGIGQSVEEMISMISLSSLLISYDSGSAQIARGLDIPTFVIVGITDGGEHHTCDSRNWYIYPKERHTVVRAYISDLESIDKERALDDIKKLSFEEVKKELDIFLSSLKFSKKPTV